MKPTVLASIFFVMLTKLAMAQPFPDALDAHQKRMQINIEHNFFGALDSSSLIQELQEEIKRVSKDFVVVSKAKAEQMKTDYRSVFISYEKNDAAKNRLNYVEIGLKWATEIVLKSLAEISSQLQSNPNERVIRKEIKKIIKTTAQVQATDENKNYVKPDPMARIEIIPMKSKGSTQALCSAFLKLCFQESVTDLLEGLPEQQFMKSAPQEPIYWTRTAETDQLRPGLPQIPKDAAFILTMNHDHPILDLKYVRKIARELGIHRTALLTTKAVWALGKQDQDTLFVQDKDLSQKVTDVLSDNAGKSSVAIYPEGNLPFPLTQFPMISKFGAYIMARKSAIQLASKRPVYLIDIQSNLMKFSTSDKTIPLEFIVSEPELVPTEALGKRDPWSERKRLEFEARANRLETRSLMVDLKSGRMIPGTNIRAAIEITQGSKSCQTAVGL
jgi:hypothetical protein